MCGIAGVLGLDGTSVEPSLLVRMCQRLSHRGPDAEGHYLQGPIALGHRRLSIIDLATGQQPLSNEDGKVWVVFNGEIYNFQELRPELERQGHRFATHSDTEVIVHAYEQYGPDCVKRFRGMFAFALWDERQRTLLLARDHIGKKPLFYTRAGGQFIFASELQSLVEHPAVPRRLDVLALDDYLTYGYIPAPRTIYEGVYKLPPAHYLTLSLPGPDRATEQCRIERFWQLRYAPKLKLEKNEVLEQFREILTEAVRLRLIADVPLGALLSGGIDSSLIVALMSRLSSRAVKTFSVGFDEQEWNELPYSKMVAEQYHTEHHELLVRPNALEILPKLVQHYGEPFADSSAIPSYYVAQLTRQHVTVVLNGDGGDECCAGYERYLGSLLAEQYHRLPQFVRSGVRGLATLLIPDTLSRRSRLRQARRFLQSADLPLIPRYLRWVSYFSLEQKSELYTPEVKEMLQGRQASAWLMDLFAAQRQLAPETLDTLLAVDCSSYLPYDLLVKMDIATMANSLEARSPFLDHRVLEFTAQLPGHWKIRRGTLKYLLRRLGQELLPPAILKRRKMGFGVPVGEWLRQERRGFLEDMLLSPQARSNQLFQSAYLKQLIQTHQEGRQDFSQLLWALLWFELWHRHFLP